VTTQGTDSRSAIRAAIDRSLGWLSTGLLNERSRSAAAAPVMTSATRPTLDRASGRGDDVLSGLRFLISRQRSRTKRAGIENLSSYLTNSRSRMFYRTFRDAGLRIGSGFIESDVAHVVQQRMKRAGMHW